MERAPAVPRARYYQYAAFYYFIGLHVFIKVYSNHQCTGRDVLASVAVAPPTPCSSARLGRLAQHPTENLRRYGRAHRVEWRVVFSNSQDS